MIEFNTQPEQYQHWSLEFDGPVATLKLGVNEDGGLLPGYKLKLNSYDLGVDIELHDAVQRLRFENPEIRTVVITSAMEKVFCAGANITMLGLSTHAHKVNFCKFTNETVTRLKMLRVFPDKPTSAPLTVLRPEEGTNWHLRAIISYSLMIVPVQYHFRKSHF